MKRLVILGARGHAQEVHWLVDTINASAPAPVYDVLGHLDDDPGAAQGVEGIEILGPLSWLETGDRDVRLALGVGFPRTKRLFVERAEKLGYQFETLVHPRVEMSRSVRIGNGSIIAAGCVITVDIVLGEHVLVNSAVTIGHGSRIGKYATLSPHATLSGNTILEEGVDMGAASTTKPGVRVGAWAVVGLNAGVVKDLPPGMVAMGCPATPRYAAVERYPVK